MGYPKPHHKSFAKWKANQEKSRENLRKLLGFKEGRPRAYNPTIATEIVGRLAAGGEPLTKILKDPHMPTPAIFYRWLRQDSNLRERVNYAREQAAYGMMDDCIEIADNVEPDRDHVAKAKVQITTRVRIASSLNRAQFGTQVKHQHDGQVSHALTFGSILPEQTHLQESEAQQQLPAQQQPQLEEGDAPSLLPGKHVVDVKARAAEATEDGEDREA